MKGAFEAFEGDDGEGARDSRVRSGPCARSGGNVLTPVREEEEQVGGCSTGPGHGGNRVTLGISGGCLCVNWCMVCKETPWAQEGGLSMSHQSEQGTY